ncbi:hypothetical protein ACTXT7_000080 [Hymenolepis weldensis]
MTENIFLFVPNIIGYVRILLLIAACCYMPSDPIRAIVTYFLSALLDAVDGYVARLLNQSTKFGAMLDMLSDRCTTMCLLFVLGTFYPHYLLLFQLSAAIDIASHWLHVHVSIQSGSSSHKAIDLDGNPLLRIYYTNRKVLFGMCAGNELFYGMLYLLHFFEGPKLPCFLLGVGMFYWLLFLSLPIALLKTFISLVHLYAASVNIAGLDATDRRNLQSSQKKNRYVLLGMAITFIAWLGILCYHHGDTFDLIGDDKQYQHFHPLINFDDTARDTPKYKKYGPVHSLSQCILTDRASVDVWPNSFVPNPKSPG